MNSLEMNTIFVNYYNLGAVYYRKILSKCCVCIFMHISINDLSVTLDTFCIDQVIEICAIKLQSARQNICTVAIY
jgi:hypothetical protein